MKKKYYQKYEITPCQPEKPTLSAEAPSKDKKNIFSFKLFSNMALDDILILVLIFVMLTEDEPDYLTILALGFLLFS